MAQDIEDQRRRQVVERTDTRIERCHQLTKSLEATIKGIGVGIFISGISILLHRLSAA